MDYTMLPLECLYLNKNALINVVGQPVSMFYYLCMISNYSVLFNFTKHICIKMINSLYTNVIEKL